MASRQDAPPAGGGESGQTDDEDIGPPADLSHAGAVVDKAIEYMVGQMIGPMAIASALLGGALGVLSGSLDDEAILKVLDNAKASVRAGELRDIDGGRA